MGSGSSVPKEVEEPENSVSQESTGNYHLRSNEVNFLTNDANTDGASRPQSSLSFLVHHSLNDRTTEDGKKNPLGIAAKYLAEENIRLKLANDNLTKSVKSFNSFDSYDMEHKGNIFIQDVDRDYVHGESTEQRLKRLEKHLASERREKWAAIEKNEKTRVNLVNCEKELAKTYQLNDILRAELNTSKARLNLLQNAKKIKEDVEDVEELSGKKQETQPESLNSFRAELKAKREARQKALSAITTEMNGLREEIQKEKAMRRKLQKELETRKQNITDVSLENIISDNNALKNEIDILIENAERLQSTASENIKLKFEAQRLNAEMDSLNLNLGALKFEYYEEKRKHERTAKKLTELENQWKSSVQHQNDWKEEKARFYETYDREKEEITKRTNAMKDVILITRQMLAIRESQVQELKVQLKNIEESVKRSKLMEENGLKAEYEKQLENIKNLKQLYEERVHLMESEQTKLSQNLLDKTKLIQKQETEILSLRNHVEANVERIKLEREENENLNREFRLTVAKCKDLENELSIINNLFTQMLLGPLNTGSETDLDKLTELLQENHDLIAEITTREDSSEIASVLPKLLLDLIAQVDGINESAKNYDMTESCDTISEQSESLLAENQGAVLPILSYKNATLFKPPISPKEPPPEEDNVQINVTNDNISPTVQEIVSNLPKVWKVLMELLSHHSTREEPVRGDEKQCYKKVETPNGPRTVISVSKTFIRLKDLILEKKTLQKELTRLKQLNSHLETRLDDQEKRLSQVQCELHKTWGIVGRMRAQHQQLHNHEKILRYELQEKRVMLSELKQELEYCREKWKRARQKNDDTETEWRKLRREFAARKSKGYPFSALTDSGESGFSDEHESGEDCDADRSSTQSPVDKKLLEDLNDKVEADNLVRNLGTNVFPVENLKEVKKDVEEKLEKTEEETRPKTENNCPSTSRCGHSDSDEKEKAKDLRLKRLEEQCQLLVRQVDITSQKSKFLNNRLEELHEQYGAASSGDDGFVPQVPTAEEEEGSERTDEDSSAERRNTTTDKVIGDHSPEEKSEQP